MDTNTESVGACSARSGVERHFPVLMTLADYSFIREDQKRREEERLEQVLLEGIRSGPGKIITPKEWEKLRKRISERLKSKQRV